MKPNKVYYTWKDIEHMTNTITGLIFADNWRPDYIVGLTRGGLTPAVIMSNQTGITMHALDVRFRDTDAKNYGPESNTWMAEDAFGYVDIQHRINGQCYDTSQRKNILIIDDINDSGRTLAWIKDDWRGGCMPDDIGWESVFSNNVRTACLVDNGASEFDCDYTAQEINKEEDDVWIVFPWEGERNYGNA